MELFLFLCLLDLSCSLPRRAHVVCRRSRVCCREEEYDRRHLHCRPPLVLHPWLLLLGSTKRRR